MVPGQEANSDKIGIFFFDFLHNNCVDCITNEYIQHTIS